MTYPAEALLNPWSPAIGRDAGAVRPVAAHTGITVVDLDRTLTRRGTYSPFLLFAAARRAPWRLAFVPVVPFLMLAHKAGLVDRKRLKESMHRLMLGSRIAQPALAALAEAYAERTLARNTDHRMVAVVAKEAADGRLVVLATAAHRFYAEPIARRLGIVHVVATESRCDADLVRHRIDGPNCHGPAKLAAVAAALERLGMRRGMFPVRCYSDDHSDLPLFEWGDEPVAVNPSAPLRRHAEARGWPVIGRERVAASSSGRARTPVAAMRRVETHGG